MFCTNGIKFLISSIFNGIYVFSPQQKKWEKPGCPSPLIAKSKLSKFNQTQMTT